MHSSIVSQSGFQTRYDVQGLKHVLPVELVYEYQTHEDTKGTAHVNFKLPAEFKLCSHPQVFQLFCEPPCQPDQ